MRRQKIAPALRFEVLSRDGFRCKYCGADASDAELHVDHINPVANGGSDATDNLCACCRECNYGKSDRRLIPSGDGYRLTPDKRPARLARARAKERGHWIDSDVLDVDDRDDDNWRCLLHCATHDKVEWHWLADHVYQSVVNNGPDPGWVIGADDWR